MNLVPQLTLYRPDLTLHMATIQSAQAKYERRTSGAGEKWKRAASAGTGRYCSEFARFVGHSTPQACSAQAAGVNATSAADYQAAVSGKASKWAARMAEVA